MEPAAIGASVIRPMAVMYIRVSTRDQAERAGELEGFSIPAQREACYRKAESMGLQVVAEFVDAGESARSANRPELQKMLTFVGQHKVGYCIVHKVDRLARNRADDVEINLKLRAAGAQLVSVSENIDETPSGMLLHGIMSTIAEFYSQNLAAEAKKGMLQKAKVGGTPHKAPFGYLNTRHRDEVGREARIVELDPDRAHWVRWIYDRYNTGEWTVPMIAAELDRLGVRTLPTPNRPAAALAQSTIDTILQSRYYVGVVTFQGAEYAGKHPALISEEAYAKARAVRQGRRVSGERPRVHTHYLKGTVACGQCGELLGYAKSRNRLGNYYQYFYCMGRQHDRNGCTFRATQVHVVEALIEDYWSDYTLGESRVAEVRRLILEHLEAVSPNRKSERAEAERHLALLEAQSKKLVEAHLADAIDLDSLKREQDRIAVQRAMHKQTLSRLDVSETAIRDKIDEICGFLARAQTTYLQSADLGRRDLNQAVFKRLYIEDDEVVGADLRPAFQTLLSDTLQDQLRSERKQHLSTRVRTNDHLYLTEVPRAGDRGDISPSGDLRPRRVSGAQIGLETILGAVLRRERPRGRFSWEATNPAPWLVRGSNERVLVGVAGIEPATTSL